MTKSSTSMICKAKSQQVKTAYTLNSKYFRQVISYPSITPWAERNENENFPWWGIASHDLSVVAPQDTSSLELRGRAMYLLRLQKIVKG